jgi:hypothetical protein
VKPSEYPEKDIRSVPFETAKSDSMLVDSPRYIDPPAAPERSRGLRNLAWGVISLLLAGVGFWLGHYFPNGVATQTMLASLGSFGVIWLLYNFRVLRQRNGVFLALGLVAFLGAIIPFIGVGFRKLDMLAKERIVGQADDTEAPAPSATLPVPTAATAPPAPQAPKDFPAAATQPPMPKEAADDGIVRDFVAPVPDAKAGKLIRIAEDCVVKIDGRKWRLKKDQIYQYLSLEDGMVTFKAGDQDVTISSEFVVFTGKSQESPAKITAMAAEEAASRYPELREEGSRKHTLYLARKMEIEADIDMKKIFFADPKWPLVLAEQLAETNGWDRADVADGNAADVSDSNEDVKPGAPEVKEEDAVPDDKSLSSPPAKELPPVPAN